MAKLENDIYVQDNYLNLQEDESLKPLMRLTLKRREKFFGPGVATLMHLIDEYGSIQSAAKHMEMSYSKAWKIIRRAEEELGFALVASKNGGAGGGRSELSEEGRAFLRDYDALTAEVKAFTAEAAERYFKAFRRKLPAEQPGEGAALDSEKKGEAR